MEWPSQVQHRKPGYSTKAIVFSFCSAVVGIYARLLSLPSAFARGSSISDNNFEPLTRALADIVQKRWPDHKRDDADRTIIIQADGNQPAQVVLKVLAAVRVDGSLELFPNIFLAGGG